MRALNYGQADPSRSEDASKLTVREQRDISVQLPQMGYEPICAAGNLSRRLAPGATITEDIPVGPAPANVRGASSFVIAIVPFGEVHFDFRVLIQSNQGTCPPGPPARAAEHMPKFGAAQSFSQLLCFPFTVLGQRNIRAARMLVGQRPGGFTVPNKIKVEGHGGVA